LVKLLFPVVATSLPVCRLVSVSSTLVSQVLIGAVVSKLPALVIAIHGGLAVSLLERISSVLPVAIENGSNKSDDAEFIDGVVFVSVLSEVVRTNG